VTDCIQIKGFSVLASCGALPEEQARPQPIEVDLEVACDLAVAGGSDRLEDTVDYGALCDMVERVATTERFTLLERLAERLAEEVRRDDRVESVTVAVRKLRPPVPHHLATTGVRITRP
jgi:dihydroneopterin aldolase